MQFPMIPFSGNFYITDVFDIVVITILIYLVFILFQKTRTYMIFIGSLLVLGVYLLATHFSLYLTSNFLQYFFGASIIIFVIIFQSEIRKFFEIIGLIGTRQIKTEKITQKSTVLGEIVQACLQMAQEKIGGLIIFRGKSPLEYYIQHGLVVDAIISQELLLSIFNPKSPIHDGAVIIENGRISRLGVQLPLSKNSRVLKGYGTRHSAALGISEQTDAMAIVISEEKGSISVCREGKLKPLESNFDLEKEISRYIVYLEGKKSQNFLQNLIIHNIGLKFGALLVSLTLWFFSAYQAGVIQKEYVVPVTFVNQNERLVIENYSPKELSLILKGRGEAAFPQNLPNVLKVELDASSLVDGINKVEAKTSDMSIPPNLTIVDYQPQAVLLTAQTYQSYTFPIEVITTGKLRPGLSLKEISTTPSAIDIWLPKTATSPAKIFTQPINLDEIDSSSILTVPIKLPESARLPRGSEEITVAINIEENN